MLIIQQINENLLIILKILYIQYYNDIDDHVYNKIIKKLLLKTIHLRVQYNIKFFVNLQYLNNLINLT